MLTPAETAAATPSSILLSVRIDETLGRDLRDAAGDRNVSVSAWVRRELRRALDRRRKRARPAP